MESQKVCPTCGRANPANANYCTSCGDALDPSLAPGTASDDNLELRYVDPNNRVELSRYVREDDAELACGLLRANGIACELSSAVLPGLPNDIILWVDARRAKQAWALLADAEHRTSSGESDAA